MDNHVSEQMLEEFCQYLRAEERAEKTIQKYLHDMKAFCNWLGNRPVSKQTVSQWKQVLLDGGSAAVTVNAALAAVHSFLAYMGWDQYRVRYLKIQRCAFRDVSRELTREEFARLVHTARAQGKEHLALILETICATGIRVSELRYITVEAVSHRRAEVALKGKIRTILIPNKLARRLERYGKQQKITCGELFVTAGGKEISRSQIWSWMKGLCEVARVDASKVFPHNLRHLFARTFYKACGDIVELADVLGHSSVETTRIYLTTTGAEHARRMEKLGLIL